MTPHDRPLYRSIEQAVRLLVVATVAGVSIAGPLGNWTGLRFDDTDVYWEAAWRVRENAPLYVAQADGFASEYRYAPWFAWAWVPLTYLPREPVYAAWAILGLVATIVVVGHVAFQGLAGVAVAILLGVQLLWSVRGTNVQPLLIAALYFGLHSRWGPLIVAAGASLKLVPLAFVLVFVQQREWRRLAVTLVLASILTAPILLYDLSNFGEVTGSFGANFSLINLSPSLWAIGATAAIGAATWLAWRGSRFTALGAAIAALSLTPRLFVSDATVLLVGASKGGVDPQTPLTASAPRPYG